MFAAIQVSRTLLEERLTRIEQSIEKQNEAIRGLTVVARTCLDSIQTVSNTVSNSTQNLLESIRELKEDRNKDREEWIERNKSTEEKLNILIDTVDRIIRHRNDKQ
jgi:hypothetical protein